MCNRFRIHLMELVIAMVSLIVVCSKPACAYIDPGTGSYVLQVVIASLLATAFVIKSAWGNIRRAVGRRFAKRVEDDK